MRGSRIEKQRRGEAGVRRGSTDVERTQRTQGVRAAEEKRGGVRGGGY